MERLTRRKEDGSVYCRIEKGNSFIGRMAAIEDILGDDYDLDRLRCAVESLAEAEAANTQLDGVATTLMESNRKLAESLEAEKARADDAETALTAAVRDMETMALTIRQRRDHDTDCCPFCHYDCPEEDYCPGWEGEECFRWRGVEQSHKPTGDLSRDPTKMVPLTLEQLRQRVEKAGRPVVVFVVTIDPDTGERDFDGEWEMFDGDDFVADGSWDTYINYGVTFEAYAVQPKLPTDRSAPGR